MQWAPGQKNRSADGPFNGSFDRSSSRNSSYNSPYNSRPNFRKNSRYVGSSENNQNRQSYNRDNNRNRGHQQNTQYDQRNGFQNRYDKNQDRNRFDNRKRPNKFQHHRNQPRAQVIFKSTNQNHAATTNNMFNPCSHKPWIAWDILLVMSNVTGISGNLCNKCPKRLTEQNSSYSNYFNAISHFTLNSRAPGGPVTVNLQQFMTVLISHTSFR